MKLSLKFILLLIVILMLVSCGASDTESGDGGDVENGDGGGDIDEGKWDRVSPFTMKAELLEVNDNLSVNVIEAEYASGIFHIIISDTTEIYGRSGEKIGKTDLQVGNILTITYSGQVMMSYPPQTVALKITVA